MARIDLGRPATTGTFPRATGVASPRGSVAALVPPQSLPVPREEPCVIRNPADAGPVNVEATPGSGTAATKAPRTGELVPVPLKHTDVKASISGYVASVTVTQQFHNPYDG
jgi:hypothetical protein